VSVAPQINERQLVAHLAGLGSPRKEIAKAQLARIIFAPALHLAVFEPNARVIVARADASYACHFAEGHFDRGIAE
jgi:hypothetical protein